MAEIAGARKVSMTGHGKWQTRIASLDLTT